MFGVRRILLQTDRIDAAAGVRPQNSNLKICLHKCRSYAIMASDIAEENVERSMVVKMALLEQWRDMAYDQQADKGKLQRFWAAYFEKEKEIYAELLKNPDEVVKGTVKELADRFGIDVMTMTGFLDGINDSLVEENPIEEMKEDTVVNLGFDKALLYKNMVAAEADWLYNLEEWNDIFDEETRKELYKEQKRSTTIVKEAKVYPNDPCPCGSGKKYKKCCGKNK